MTLQQLKKYILLTFFLVGFLNISNAQSNLPLLLKSGHVEINNTIEQSKNEFTRASTSVNDKIRIIQFYEIPTNETKAALANGGIVLLNYLPKNAFYARVEKNAKWQVLMDSKVSFITTVENSYKLSTDLSNEIFNDWALPSKNTIALNASYFDYFSANQITTYLTSLGAKNINVSKSEVASFTIKLSNLNALYSQEAFYYFEQIDPPSEPENLVGVTNHRSNTLATSYNSGLKLNGEGVTVMLQDNSRLDDHIDYTGRFFNDATASNSGDHGEHCGGIIAGAGNIDPTARGMAYGAEVLVYSASDANYNDVPQLVATDDLTITSKSYGGGLNAGYNTIARTLDQQIRQNPSLMHVFSAGNSNGSGFTNAGGQWFNITGGHKSGKNVMAVGNVTFTDNIAGSSSRGPSEDGRIKPDICAVGTDVYSTVDPHQYDSKTGTSMACPGVAGTLAQLYQGYKELNGGINPNSALIKAAVLNTGDDLGNTGPDFTYGWGRINARRAYEVITNNTYFSGNISQGNSLTHSINIPAGTEQLRVMVYWSDYEASTSASQALVNDINMTITTPNSNVVQPWILNNTANPSQLNSLATQGTDSENNMEQVTIDAPIAGAYTINLNGVSIPQGPQEYFIVYEFVSNDITLTYPIGGESFVPSEDEIIRWDAFGNSGSFTLEYSTDNGLTWNIINSNIAGDARYRLWNVPNTITGQAIVRVSRGSSVSQSHEPFSIIDVPAGLTVTSMCPDSVSLSWTNVNSATGYEVSMLGGLYMDSVGTTASNSITLAHSAANEFWWSVKALGANDCVGRRAIAQFQAAGVFNCTLDRDVAITDLESLDGRNLLSCIDADDVEIGITLSNSGISPVSNIPVNYKLNNGTIVSETFNGTIQPNSSQFFSFANQQFIPFGANTLAIWTTYPNDQNIFNDSITSTFNYLNAAPASLPFFEDFESFNLCNTASNCEEELCELTNNFVNSRNGVEDDIDWRTNSGNTPSNNTGPNRDFNPGFNSGKYLYLEPSGDPICENKEAFLVTPCIELNESAILKFAYHMLGEDMGDLHIDILVNDSWINDIAPVISGNKGVLWQVESIDLSPYAGNIINIRFRGITGTDFESDIAIDDISITSTASITDNVKQSFDVYPNPNKGLFYYKTVQAQNSIISVTDANGKEVYRSISQKDNGTIDLTNLSAGIYFVKAVMDAETIVKKIIIE